MKHTSALSDYRDSSYYPRRYGADESGAEALIEYAADRELPISPLLKVFLMTYDDGQQSIAGFVDQIPIETLVQYSQREYHLPQVQTAQELLMCMSLILSDARSELIQSLSTELEELLGDLHQTQFYTYLTWLESQGLRESDDIIQLRLDHQGSSVPFGRDVAVGEMEEWLTSQLGSTQFPGMNALYEQILETISPDDNAIRLDPSMQLLNDNFAMMSIIVTSIQEWTYTEEVSYKVAIHELVEWLSVHFKDMSPSQILYKDYSQRLSDQMSIYDIQLSSEFKKDIYKLSDGKKIRSILEFLKSGDYDDDQRQIDIFRDQLDIHPGVGPILQKEASRRSTAKLEDLLDAYDGEFYVTCKSGEMVFIINDYADVRLINKQFGCKRPPRKVRHFTQNNLQASFSFSRDDQGQIVCCLYDESVEDIQPYEVVMKSADALSFIKKMIVEVVPLSQCLVVDENEEGSYGYYDDDEDEEGNDIDDFTSD